jgi:hypothetical protein
MSDWLDWPMTKPLPPLFARLDAGELGEVIVIATRETHRRELCFDRGYCALPKYAEFSRDARHPDFPESFRTVTRAACA